ncbi:hypothetical protein A2U01_0006408, partial [Trifolium medium]|nr:hypothetical protein [Trifolium medium]
TSYLIVEWRAALSPRVGGIFRLGCLLGTRISFGMPPRYSSSLKPSTSLPPSLGLAVSVLTEHISSILLFVIPPDLPLGFDGPPVMDAVVRLLFQIFFPFGFPVVGIFGGLDFNCIFELNAIFGVVTGALVVSAEFIFVRPRVFSWRTDFGVSEFGVEAVLKYLLP